jgi:hypothetical protein
MTSYTIHVLCTHNMHSEYIVILKAVMYIYSVTCGLLLEPIQYLESCLECMNNMQYAR